MHTCKTHVPLSFNKAKPFILHSPLLFVIQLIAFDISKLDQAYLCPFR